jgi:hypothetical protein
VRRSQILRDLKRLAVMKCHVAALRLAVSHKTEIDAKRVSDQAADLLLRLDFISVSLYIYIKVFTHFRPKDCGFQLLC